MNDFEKLINASDLFDWIMETYPDWCVGAIRGIVDHIKKMPSAEPERKNGRWIGVDDYPYESWECDQCGCIYEEMPSWVPNFCPNCGAKMVEGEEE